MAKTYVNGKVYVRRTQCDTCIFRPGNLMHLQEGRVDEMVTGALENESCIPCHHHLYEGQEIEPVCRGFFARHHTVPIRLAILMNILEWVDD
jgi:hypothetical protein